MAFGYLVVALLAAAVAVFALQNSEPVTVHFLFWSVRPLPVAGVTLAALAVGLIVAGLPLAIARRRWRSRSQSLEARVASLENVVAERDRTILSQPPPRPAGSTTPRPPEPTPPRPPETIS